MSAVLVVGSLGVRANLRGDGPAIATFVGIGVVAATIGAVGIWNTRRFRTFLRSEPGASICISVSYDEVKLFVKGLDLPGTRGPVKQIHREVRRKGLVILDDDAPRIRWAPEVGHVEVEELHLPRDIAVDVLASGGRARCVEIRHADRFLSVEAWGPLPETI